MLVYLCLDFSGILILVILFIYFYITPIFILLGILYILFFEFIWKLSVVYFFFRVTQSATLFSNICWWWCCELLPIVHNAISPLYIQWEVCLGFHSYCFITDVIFPPWSLSSWNATAEWWHFRNWLAITFYLWQSNWVIWEGFTTGWTIWLHMRY